MSQRVPKQIGYLSILFLVFVFNLAFSQGSKDQINLLLAQEKYKEVIKEAQLMLVDSPDYNSKGELFQLQADAYYYLNDIENSLAHYLKAIAQFELSLEPNLLHFLECYSHAGFCYRELGIFDKALSYYLKASQLSLEYSDSTEIAAQYANIGLVYGRLGDIESATNYHLKAYAIDLTQKDTSGLGFDLRNIADLKIAIGEHQEAIDAIRESIRLLNLSEGNTNSLALRNGALGKSFLALGQTDSAKLYLNISLNEHIKLNDSIHIALRWVDLALLYISYTEYNKSIDLAHLARKYFLGLGENQHLTLANLALIQALKKAGRFQNAMHFVEENIVYCTRQGLLIELKQTYKEQSEILQLQGQSHKALNVYLTYQQLEDSIKNINNTRAISLLEIKYDVYKMEQENQILLLENEVNRAELAKQDLQMQLMLIIFSIIAVAIIVIAWFIISRQKLKRTLLLSEINQLRSQIMAVLEGKTHEFKIDAKKINENLNTPLTAREFEILHHAISDLSNNEIAEKTYVSVNTVKYHLKNIYEKIGVGNRKEALHFAIQTAK